MIPQRETAASKLACGKSRLEAADCTNSTLSRAAAAARSRPNASISAEMSVATTRPSGPTLRAAVSAGSPLPAATSRTRLPDCTPASSTSRWLMCPAALSWNSLHSFHPTAAESHCSCCTARKSTGSIAFDSMLAPPRHRVAVHADASGSGWPVNRPRRGAARPGFRPGRVRSRPRGPPDLRPRGREIGAPGEPVRRPPANARQPCPRSDGAERINHSRARARR